MVQPNIFPAIISQKRFDAVQRKLNDRVFLRSNERMLDDLRDFISKHGRATELMLNADRTMPKVDTYAKRFGSLSRAIALVTPEPVSGWSEIEWRALLKLDLQDKFARALTVNGVSSQRKNGTFRSASHPPVLLDVACCRVLKNGELRWQIRYPLTGVDGLHCITLRLNPDNRLPLDYLLIHSLPPGNQRYRLNEERIHRLASIHRSLDEAVNMLLHVCNSSIHRTEAATW